MTNPTSNFGWQMPEPTDLVTNLPADFEVFGQAVDTDFADLLGGTTGQVLSKTSNTDLDFTWVSDATGMTNPMTTTGDIIYSSPNSTPVRLGIGSAGNVLTVASGVPSWSAPAGGGKVLQVVSTLKSDTFTSSSTSFIDITGLSVTITPTANTSKVLVLIALNMSGKSATGVGMARLLRGSTVVYAGDAASNRTLGFYSNIPGSAEGDDSSQVGSGVFLDSPGTTSATTYKIQGLTNAGTFFVNRTANDNDSTYILRGVSSITVMEIGA